MKKILFLLLASVICNWGYSQVFSADAGLGQPYTTDGSNNLVDPNLLALNAQAKLRLPVFNSSLTTKIPARTTRLQIDLGTGLQLLSPATIASSPLSAYFTWSVQTISGNQMITGEQMADIPADFTGFAEFNVVAYQVTPPQGGTVLASWLVTNLGGAQTLNEYNNANNNSSMLYTTSTSVLLPVKFVSIEASGVNCNINVNWKVAEEVNVSHYEVMVSNNGTAFRSLARVSAAAANAGAYASGFAIPSDMKGQMLFVQVKEVDKDGKYTMSSVKTVSGNCDNLRPLVVYAYPNPVTSGGYINIAAKEGIFNGKYKLELVDNNGKLYQAKEVELNNAVSVPFEFRSRLTPGKYMIRISSAAEAKIHTVPFVLLDGVL